jgi:hypothetical protein
MEETVRLSLKQVIEIWRATVDENGHLFFRRGAMIERSTA